MLVDDYGYPKDMIQHPCAMVG